MSSWSIVSRGSSKKRIWRKEKIREQIFLETHLARVSIFFGNLSGQSFKFTGKQLGDSFSHQKFEPEITIGKFVATWEPFRIFSIASTGSESSVFGMNSPSVFENIRGAKIFLENLRGMKIFNSNLYFPKNTPTGYPDWSLTSLTKTCRGTQVGWCSSPADW